MLRMVVPSPELVDVVRPCVFEYVQDDIAFQTNDVKRMIYAYEHDDWNWYFKKLYDDEYDVDSHDGWLPTKTWWLMDGDVFVGVCSVRIGVNDKLIERGGNTSVEIRPSLRGRGYGYQSLKLRLEKANELGMMNLLITCDVENIASKNNIKKVLKEYSGREIEGAKGECAFVLNTVKKGG